jgi:hypothetical protein
MAIEATIYGPGQIAGMRVTFSRIPIELRIAADCGCHEGDFSEDSDRAKNRGRRRLS